MGKPADPIAKAVLRAMVAQGLSNRGLSRMASVPRPSLVRWFNGAGQISMANLCRVLAVLDLEVRPKGPRSG